MAAPSNLVLQLLITAKDNATAVFTNLFGFLDNKASVVAEKVRAAFTNLFGGGLEGAIEFEAQLDKVQAKGGYTTETMVALKKAAEDIGAQFGVTGTEAAQGMESLAAAGLNATEVMQALPVVLNLAKVEALGMDEASALLANSLTTVGLGFEEAGRLADVLTQAANESTTSASAVGKALETAGGIARASALDLEQTVAALTALAKGGIEGERAGTALQAILTQLLNPASAASKALNELGITSRDLGTVIGELESRGADANTAILAFGETAGPGLRALIAQGQGGLKELEAAMRGAEGAAGTAADQMGGNLKTALSSLESAWEAVKTALSEPVLEPLAKAAADAGAAINGSLREGALKPVQEAIKSLAENSIQFARDFVASFDFKAVVASLQDFARNAGETFTTIADRGRQSAAIVTVAWNAVTGSVKAISAAMLEVATAVVTTLANIEEAASQVGLGSVERATALQQKANALKDTARELRASAQQDAEELFAAYDRVTPAVNAAAAAQKNLKAALPVAELQTLTKTLDDYRGIAERANTQSAQAAKDFEAGKISAQDYGAKLLAAAEASQELADQIQATANAATFGKEALAAQLNTLQQTAQADAELAEAQDAVRRSALNLIQAEIELARAKGNTAEVTRLLNVLADTEIEQARAVAAEKDKEAASLRAQLANRLAYRASLDATNAALEQEIQLLVARTNAANGDAAAAQKQVEALEATKKKRKEATEETVKAKDATDQQTEAIARNSEVQQVNIQHTKDAGQAAQGLANYLQQARQVVDQLSESTRQLFEVSLTDALNQAGIDSYEARRLAIVAYKNGLNAAQSALTELNRKQAEADALVEQSTLKLQLASNGYRKWEAAIELATGKAQAAFYEQAIAAEQSRQRIEAALDGSAQVLEQLVIGAQSASRGFNLLDQEDLSGLQSAIDQATAKLREMQEATEDARVRLAELNAEILQEQGEDQKADLLRQQLDYQEQLAELERQRQEAELFGNQELLAILDQQEQKLRTLNDLRVKNIQADADSSVATNRTTSSVSRLADEAERAGRALSAVSAADLSKLSLQSETLRRNFSDLSNML